MLFGMIFPVAFFSLKLYNERKREGGVPLEFLLIGDSKLKIVLTSEEMIKYKLDKSPIEINGAGVRRSFWQVLDAAKCQVGFDPDGDKILIQLYPLKDGGCEIFVTKLGILPETSARLVAKSKKVSLLSKKQSIYSFDYVDDLINASRAIMHTAGDISIVADAYYGEDRYFLIIDEYGKSGEALEFPCILEFGRALTADFYAFISENCSLLAKERAIEIFSKL